MEIQFKKIIETAQMPTYSSDGAACFDLYCTVGGSVPAGASAVFDTGIACAVPDGHVMMVYSRSGHGFKNGITLVNGTGVIDSDYRGSIKVGLRNDSMTCYMVKDGERVAQGMIIPVQQVSFVEVYELSETIRGDGGLLS